MSDIAEKILARLDEIERLARAAAYDSRAEHWEAGGEWSETVTAADGGYILCAPYEGILDWDLRRFLVAHDPASVLRRCAADREIVEEHKPVRESVEWPDDQTGTGHAWVCPRCQNAENDSQNWFPPPGKAGVFPHENFVTAYVLAPCKTLLSVARGYGIQP